MLTCQHSVLAVMLVDFWSMTKAGQRFIVTTAFDFFHVYLGSHNDLFIVTPLSSLSVKGYFFALSFQ